MPNNVVHDDTNHRIIITTQSPSPSHRHNHMDHFNKEEKEEEIQILSTNIENNKNHLLPSTQSSTSYHQAVNETISKHKIKQYESELTSGSGGGMDGTIYSGCLYQLFAPFYMLFGGVFSSSNNNGSSKASSDKPPTREETSSLLLGDEEDDEENSSLNASSMYSNQNHHQCGEDDEDLESYLNRSLEGATSVLHKEEQQLYSKFKDSSYRNIFESKSGEGNQQQPSMSTLSSQKTLSKENRQQHQNDLDDLLNFNDIPKNELLTLNPFKQNSDQSILVNSDRFENISLEDEKSETSEKTNTKETTTTSSLPQQTLVHALSGTSNVSSFTSSGSNNNNNHSASHSSPRVPTTTVSNAKAVHTRNTNFSTTTTTQPPQPQHYTPPVIDEETFSNLLQQHYEDDDDDEDD